MSSKEMRPYKQKAVNQIEKMENTAKNQMLRQQIKGAQSLDILAGILLGASLPEVFVHAFNVDEIKAYFTRWAENDIKSEKSSMNALRTSLNVKLQLDIKNASSKKETKEIQKKHEYAMQMLNATFCEKMQYKENHHKTLWKMVVDELQKEAEAAIQKIEELKHLLDVIESYRKS